MRPFEGQSDPRGLSALRSPRLSGAAVVAFATLLMIATGTYEVNIGQNAIFCSATATVGLYDPGGDVVLVPRGYASTTIEPDSPIVTVYTFDNAGSAANSAFMIQVICSPFFISF